MPYPNQYVPQYTGYQPAAPYPAAQYSQQSFQQQQQPVHGFVYVTGIEGAKAYPMGPNSEMPLFDSTNDGVMYIKTTDGAGYPTIKPVRCSPMDQQVTDVAVTRDDLDRMYKDLAGQIEQLRGAINGAVPTTTGTSEPDDVPSSGRKR